MKSVWYKQFPSFRVTQGWKYTFALIYCLYNLTVALNQILSADVLTDLIANHKFCYLFFLRQTMIPSDWRISTMFELILEHIIFIRVYQTLLISVHLMHLT